MSEVPPRRPRDTIRLRDDRRLVERQHASAAHDPAALDHHGFDVARLRLVHERGHHAHGRRQMRAAEIDDDQVGAIARRQPAAVGDAERAIAVARGPRERLLGRRPAPEDVLTWATRNGYRALGVADGGWLAPGNRADLIVVDLRTPHLAPVLRVVSDFVHNGQAGDVESVMVDGHWIMRDHRVLTLDEPALVAEAERVARAAWSRLFAARPDLPRPPGLELADR